MERVAELQTRIRSLTELRNVVGAMRSLSAVRVQQAHETILAIRQYTATITRALVEATPILPPPKERPPEDEPITSTIVVAFGSEHGFVGAFNNHVLEHAAAHLENAGDRLFIVGSRGAMVAAEQHHVVTWSCPMASHVGGVDEVALRVAEEIARVGSSALAKVVLIYTRSTGGALWRVVAETLLPFDLAPYVPRSMDRPTPISNLASRALLDKLIEELVFAQLTHAAMESFASESTARRSAMESAYDNIEDKLTDLGRLEREGRQDEITTELLDVITGAEAMADATP